MPDKSFDEMSDEEFLNSLPPEELGSDSVVKEEEEPEEKIEEQEEEPAEETSEEETSNSEEESEETPEESPAEETSSEPEKDQTIDYKSAYEKIMAPFKANGTTISLQNPDEVIQLMQKGANYTRKMQELAPQRKVLKMLEKNNLLDQDKLEFFIELNNKNPEAIKKFIKDNSIDPLEIDTSEEPKYKAGSHRVTDEEVAFDSVLDEIQSDPEGQATIEAMADWDQRSKELLWKYPETMRDILSQRKSGQYKLISAEVERQRILGNISSETPFLVAYKQIMDATQPKQVAKQPIARGNFSKPTTSNANKVKAASVSRASAKTTQTFKNPLAMSDEEFLKQYGN